MAPGLYLGYIDQEYRSRDSDHEIFRKKDRSLEHSDRCRSNGKIVHDRVKGSRREAKGRGFIYRSHPQVKRSADREPGELSGKGIVFNHADGILVNGKRKFPPTLCDIQKTEQKRPRSDISFSCIGHEAQDLVDKAWLSDPAQEPERVGDDEEFASTRNISSSRWADGNEGVDDGKSEVLEEGFLREGSEGSVSKQTCSIGDRNDTMDVDDEESSGSENDGSSGSDSEVEAAVSSPLRNINMLQGCRDVDEFEKLNRINEGTYGVVFRARDKKSGEVVALKKVKLEKETEGFPLTALREINILLSFQHPSIVNVKEIVMGNLNSVLMVMEYMEHDLKGLMESMKQPFSQSEVKCLMLQLIAGVKYLHDNWVLHRDLKISNILFNNRGELKICDFGLYRQYGSPLKPYTQLVVTLWYRAPELLLGTKEYSTAIDMWSLGCIMAELLAKEPLFSGNTEIDQLNKIFRTLGTPNEKIWSGLTKLPGIRANFAKQPYNKLREKFPPTSFTGRPTLSEAGFDLLNRLLTYDPEKRITAAEALNHAWFCEVPLPKSKDFMPTFPAQNSQDRRLSRDMKSPDPLGELRSKELQQGGVFTDQLFTSLISVRTLFCDGVDRKKPILFAALILRSGILASYFFLFNELNETVQHIKIIVKECFTHQDFLLQYSKINGFSYFLHYYAFF